MINKVSFQGREECLTGAVKKAKAPAVEYITESSILPELAAKVKNEVPADKLAEAYRAAHVPYTEPKVTAPTLTRYDF